MPSERFKRLKPKKRNAIRSAILKQLKEAPLEKFSAKKLTQELELAQGSFYGYFSGIDDMVEFVIEDYINFEELEFKSLIEKLKVKNLTSFTDLIYKVTEYAQKNGYLDVLKNLSHGLKLTMNSSFEVLIKDRNEIYNVLEPIAMESMGNEGLGDREKEGFRILFKDAIDMGVLAYRRVMAEIYNDFENRESYIFQFERKIRILISGLTAMMSKIKEEESINV